jgi:hypothetical protein
MLKKHLFQGIGGFTVAAVLATQPVLAVDNENVRFRTTEDLYQVCSVKPDAPEYIPASFACRGFIAGAVQYHDEVTDRKHLKRLICYPKGTTVANGREAFVAWAEKNAGNKKLMSEVPVVGLVRALAAKYPCKG